MEVRQGNLKDALDVARLALVLWPDHSLHAMALEVLESIQRKCAAYFLANKKYLFIKDDSSSFKAPHFSCNYP